MKLARACCLLGMLFLGSRASNAQAPVVGPSMFEIAGSGSAVSNGYGDWVALSMRAALAVGPRTVFLPEVTTSQEFHDRGTLFGLGVTQTLSEPWYAFAAVSGGTGAFYLPSVRVTALLNRKLLPSRRLVVNAGGSYAKWKDAHNDRGIAAGALYYFESPLILEVGTNRNFSYPGNVQSQSYFATAIEGRPGSHTLVLRASGGREAYQVLAPGQPIADFSSHAGSVTLRQWLTPKAGAVVGAEHYGNEFYQRNGFTLGAFWNLE